MENKLEELYIIRDEMLLNPNVASTVVWDAARLATEDDYLYKIMLDWMRETNLEAKKDILKEITDYTEEVLRKLSVRH